MRPLSQQFALFIPGVIAIILAFISAAPLPGGTVTYTPNIAWLMTLVMVAHHDESWPPSFAFLLGLLQDVLFATPLGAQALLTLFVVQFATYQRHNKLAQPFRLKWLEVAIVLVLFHVLLGFLIMLGTGGEISLRHLLRAGIVNVLWYPLFYAVCTRFFEALPDATQVTRCVNKSFSA